VIKKIKIDSNVILLGIILVGALLITLPIVSRTPLHQDEHQFYLNAFRILKGEQLHNYLHIALTEYSLAAFLLVTNLFTDSGVNFPQGEPTAVTFYYGHIMGAVLYFLTFVLGAVIIQKREREIKLRTIFFAILYFGSLSMVERFLRVNSDSTMLVVFLNFVILSLWQHLHKPSVIETFLLNALFVFLGTFTNLKSFYLIAPLALVNLAAPFLWYEKKKNEQLQLSKVYRVLLYIFGTILTVLILWIVFAPKPFQPVNFWYTLKKTVIHGTKFDFDYPTLSYKSWLAYLYDLVVYQLGMHLVVASGSLFIIGLVKKGKALTNHLKRLVKQQLDLNILKEGQLYKATELVLFVSLVSYYLGVSLRVVHWSRWGAPIGLITIMLLSFFLERVFEFVTEVTEKTKQTILLTLPFLLIPIWSLRIALTVDMYRSNYTISNSFSLTIEDIKEFLREKNIKTEDASKKVTWFTGYTQNVNSMSFEQIAEKKNYETEYILWPHWNAGLLYTNKNVDRSTHNQRAFIDKYAENIEYRFPTILSGYMHATKKFAWETLNVTWIPELDSMVESYYAVVKLKQPHESIELQYTVPFSDMSHYKSEYSQTFNSLTLQDTYVFPPCYSYAAVRKFSDGAFVPYAPRELGQYGKTAGLYCHSVRFRVFPKGLYAIKVMGLFNDANDVQKVYFNLGDFSWDPVNKAAVFGSPETIITAEFGVATQEEYLPELNYEVFYSLTPELLDRIEKAKESTESSGSNKVK